jgi:hypothetical protein
VTPGLGEQGFVTSNQPNGIRSAGLAAIRKWHRLTKRKITDLGDLLVCPECHGSLAITEDAASCSECRVSYPFLPVPDFNRPVSLERKAGFLKRVAQC